MSVTQKPWLGILAEGAAILLSILLAFAIDAHWDLRQEQERVRSVLSTLETAYSENIAMTDVGLADTEAGLGYLQRFLGLDPGAVGGVPPDSAAMMIRSISRPGNPNPNNEFLLTLLDAESLSSLNDAALREALAQWRTSASTISHRREQITWIQRESRRALGRHAVIRPVLANLSERPDGNPAMLLAALQDDDVMALATAKANDWQLLLRHFRDQRQKSEAVLSLLQQSRLR